MRSSERLAPRAQTLSPR